MGRFWGNHPGTRQVRGSRRLSPKTVLAAAEKELSRRIREYGEEHPLVAVQKEFIGLLNKGMDSKL